MLNVAIYEGIFLYFAPAKIARNSIEHLTELVNSHDNQKFIRRNAESTTVKIFFFSFSSLVQYNLV